MAFRCKNCGRSWDESGAAENEYRCTRKCGGELVQTQTHASAIIPSWSLDRLPYPVALTALRLTEGVRTSGDALKSLLQLKDCFEAVIKYFGALLLTDYLKCPAYNPSHNEDLVAKLVRPSLGVWVSVVVGDLSRRLVSLGREGASKAASTFARPGTGKGAKAVPTRLLESCQSFVQYRNDALGHGAMRADQVYTKDFAAWLPLIDQLLHEMTQLSSERLALVTGSDQCQVWMGPVPGANHLPGQFGSELRHHFVLTSEANDEPGRPGAIVKDLWPFICFLPDSDREHRLHYYDSLYRYSGSRREVSVLEYDRGFKSASPDPVLALEESFTAALLSKAFGHHHGRMAVIEGRVAGFGDLLVAHENIVGRRFAIDYVKQFTSVNDRGLLVIEAQPGKGKTALMAHLAEHAFGTQSPPPVCFFYRRTAGLTDPDLCVRSLYIALLEAHQITEAEESRAQSDSGSMQMKLANLLATEISPRLRPSRPQLIFIDALDEAETTATGKSAFQYVPDNLPSGVFVIVSTRPVEGRKTLAQREHVDWLDLDDPSLVEQDLSDGHDFVSRFFSGTDLGVVHTKAIADAGSGNFLVLKLLCQHVRTAMAPHDVAGFLERVAKGNAGDRLGFIYQEFWDRLTERCTREELDVHYDVAGLLAYSCARLTAELVCECLRLRASQWELCLRGLIEYLSALEEEHEGHSEVFYRIYHESFADFLRARLIANRRRHLDTLADYCARWPTLGPGYGRSYALRFGPRHFLESGRSRLVDSTLRDLTFIESKCEEVGADELASDYTTVLASNTEKGDSRVVLEGLRRALALVVHRVRKRSSDVFQELYNQGAWQDAPGGPLSEQLETWRRGRDTTNRVWLRSLVPPPTPLHSNLVRTLAGHESSIAGVALTPDGRTAVSVAEDCTVRVWDLGTGQQLRFWRGHERPVNGCVLTPTSQLIITASEDATLKLWDLEGRLMRTMVGHEGAVNACAVTPDGQLVVSASDDRTLRVWSLETGTVLLVLRGHYDLVLSCAVASQSGLPRRNVVSASKDGTLKVWDLDTGIATRTLRGHTHSVTTCVVAPDGTWALSGSTDTTLRMWDLVSGSELATLGRHALEVHCLALSQDAQIAISGSRDQTLRRWNLADRSSLGILGEHSRRVNAIATHGDVLVSASQDETLKLWDLSTVSGPWRTRIHRGRVTGCSVTGSGARAVSASVDRSLVLWDRATNKERRIFTTHNARLTSCAIASDGRLVASTCQQGGLELRVWETGSLIWATAAHSESVNSCSISSGLGRVITASDDGLLKSWDLDTGAELQVFSGHDDTVIVCSITPDDRSFVSASLDETIRAWDLTSGETRGLLQGQLATELSCATTPAGIQVLIAGSDGALLLWNVEGNTKPATLAGPEAGILCCASTADGMYGLTASRTQLLQVWDLGTGRCLATYQADTALSSCGISEDGSCVIAGDEGGRVYLLEATNLANCVDRPGRSSTLPTRRVGGESRSMAADTQDTTEESMTVLAHRVQSHPDNVQLRIELAHAYVRSGDTHAAIRQFQQVLRLSRDHPDTLFNMGTEYHRLGNVKLAMAFWRKFLKMEPDSRDARFIAEFMKLETVHSPEDPGP